MKLYAKLLYTNCDVLFCSRFVKPEADSSNARRNLNEGLERSKKYDSLNKTIELSLMPCSLEHPCLCGINCHMAVTQSGVLY